MQSDENYKLSSGTTIVGLLGKDFALLAADKQTSMGYMVTNENTQKLHKLSSHIAIGNAGTVGDLKTVQRILKAQIKSYEIERNKKISLKALSNLLSNFLNNYRYYPFMTASVLIGFKDKPELYSSDAIGGTSEENKFYSVGSGSYFAIGSLETNFKENMTREEAIKVAVEAVNASRKRDAMSGGIGVDIIIASKSGLEEIFVK